MVSGETVGPQPARPDSQPGLRYRVADSHVDRLAAFQLSYDCYVRADLIQPNRFGLRLTAYHLLPTTSVFVAQDGPRAVCTVTLIGDGALGLPMESLYFREVQERRDRNIAVAEVSCLAFDPMPLGRFLMVFMQLTRLVSQQARLLGVEQLLIAVHPLHGRFYRRILGFEPIGPVRRYPAVRHAPAEPYCLDFADIDRRRPRYYETYFGVALPVKDLLPSPMGLEERRFFGPFVEAVECPRGAECFMPQLPLARRPARPRAAAFPS